MKYNYLIFEIVIKRNVNTKNRRNVMNNEFKAIIEIMRASNLLVDDLKKTLKN